MLNHNRGVYENLPLAVEVDWEEYFWVVLLRP